MANLLEQSAFPGFNIGLGASPVLNISSQPRPVYFISRSNGLLVPLVPADELPLSVRIHGLPRIVSLDQTHGMQHVGTLPYTGNMYTLEPLSHDLASRDRSSSQLSSDLGRSMPNLLYKPMQQFAAPDVLARQALAMQQSITSQPNTAMSARSPSPSSRNSPGLLPARPYRAATHSLSDVDSNAQSLIDAIMTTPAGAAAAASVGYVPKSSTPVPPSGTVPDQEKKEFCTYWIRTGNCDYMQQGCLYKHEMPDVATLRKIGFNNIPRWWVEKTSNLKNMTTTTAARASGAPQTGPTMVTQSAKPMSAWLKPDALAKAQKLHQAGGSGNEADDSDSSSMPDLLSSTNIVNRSAFDDNTNITKHQKINYIPLTPQKAPFAAAAIGNSSSRLNTPPLIHDVATTKKAQKQHTSPPGSSSSSSAGKNGAAKRVFVPAGESVQRHVAAALGGGGVASSSASPKKASRNCVVADGDGGGLMASKYAVPAALLTSTGVKGKMREMERKRDGKNGERDVIVDEFAYRVRRPAAVHTVVKKVGVAVHKA